MKTYFIAVMALMLYCTAQAQTLETSVKDSSVHEEVIVAKDVDETYTTTIYRSTNSANAMQDSEITYHEANSDEAYYKEVVVGSDGYNSSFEEKYNTESDVVNGDDLYTSHYMEGYMRDESEHNPELMRDTAVYESSKYIEDVSDIAGTYKEDIYGQSTWNSSFAEPGYSETIQAQIVWDSDVTMAPDFYESNVLESSMYDESVNEDGYESAYFESALYKEHVAEGGGIYEESIYGESVVKTSESENGESTVTYGQIIHESDLYRDDNTYESELDMSDADLVVDDMIVYEDPEVIVDDMIIDEEIVASNF